MVEDYAEKNRAAWNEVMPIHRQGRGEEFYRTVAASDFCELGEVEREVFARIGLAGKRIAHVCCNNGIELISLLKLGAAEGVGFDIADAAIAEARELAQTAGVNATFVRTNALDISAEYDAGFDIVFVSVGALTWFPDLTPFFAVCGRLLRVGGFLVIYEAHPFCDMLAMPGDPEYDAAEVLRATFSYFRTAPWVEEGGLDYIGNTTYAARPAYSFSHTFGEILTAIGRQKMALAELREYPHDISTGFEHLEHYRIAPLSYLLVARRLDAAIWESAN